MNKLLLIAMFICLSISPASARNTQVKPYSRSNGSFVMPHNRTAPDNKVFNNYSAKGNINPYTGKMGTVDPYATRTPYQGFRPESYSGGQRNGNERWPALKIVNSLHIDGLAIHPKTALGP